jgi:hypothetical protein
MSDLCRLIWCALIGIFRPRAALQAENLVLRHQLNVLRRKSPKRLAFGNVDRLVFTALYRVAPGVLDALKILKPQTVIRWHRGGFQAYWRWKSPPRGGRPKIPADIRQLIRDMSVANPLPISPRSPWQNAYVERLIGTLGRECLDQVLIYGKRRARTWGWPRTRRYDDRSNDLGPSSSHQSYPAYIINTRGYDFRE